MEASGTAQSPEAAETPQKDWEGRKKGMIMDRGRNMAPDKQLLLPRPPCGKQRQLQAIPRPIYQAISKITHQLKLNYIYLYLIIFQLGSF